MSENILHKNRVDGESSSIGPEVGRILLSRGESNQIARRDAVTIVDLIRWSLQSFEDLLALETSALSPLVSKLELSST